MANVSSSNGLEKRPKLRFPGFDGAWDFVQLSDIASYRRARKTAVKSEYVSTENMLQEFSGMEAYCDSSVIEGIAYFTGDTLIANIRPYLKKVWFATMNGVCSADVLAIQPIKVYPEFLYNMIAQDAFIEYVMSGAKGSKMPRGDKSHIMYYKTAIPKCDDEQIKIAQFLHLLTLRITKMQLLIDFLKKYKRGVRTLLNPDSCCAVNATWTTAKIGDLGTFTKGAPLSKADIAPDGTPFILYGDGELYTTYHEVINAVIRRTKAQPEKQYYSHVGDVIIPTSGETPEEISTAACVMLPDIILAGDLNIFRSSKIDGRIMSYILNHIVNGQIARIAQGKSVVHIQANELSKIEISYPDYNTQRKMIKIFDALNARTEITQKKLMALRCMQKALLQQLFI